MMDPTQQQKITLEYQLKAAVDPFSAAREQQTDKEGVVAIAAKVRTTTTPFTPTAETLVRVAQLHPSRVTVHSHKRG